MLYLSRNGECELLFYVKWKTGFRH